MNVLFFCQQPFPPHILSQPVSILKEGEGKDISLEVTAQGPKPLTYQWTRNGKKLQDDDCYGGSTTPSLLVTRAHTDLSGQYCCTVSNKGGSVTTDKTDLTIGTICNITYTPDCKT